MQPVGVDEFQHDGRGPELIRVHWDQSGSVLRAVDYRNPSDGQSRHVVFLRPQVVAIVPEEVINYDDDALGASLAAFAPAAAFDVGRSSWLESFAPRHLARCRHFQLMFYDQLFNVICEGLVFHTGDFQQSSRPAS